MEEHHDKDKTGLHDKKEEKYLNPKRDPMQHTDPKYDAHRRAGITHGIGVFLVILGVWWLLRDLSLVPHVSFWAIAALFCGVWLLKSEKRK